MPVRHNSPLNTGQRNVKHLKHISFTTEQLSLRTVERRVLFNNNTFLLYFLNLHALKELTNNISKMNPFLSDTILEPLHKPLHSLSNISFDTASISWSKDIFSLSMWAVFTYTFDYPTITVPGNPTKISHKSIECAGQEISLYHEHTCPGNICKPLPWILLQCKLQHQPVGTTFLSRSFDVFLDLDVESCFNIQKVNNSKGRVKVSIVESR